MTEMNINTISADYLKIDTAQMIEVDRLMIEEYSIELVQMMENAGRCLAIVARDYFLAKDPEGKKVCILAGTGGNGGGAMVCARRLANWGADVTVYVTAAADKMTAVPRHQFDILNRMGLDVQVGCERSKEIEFDLIIDGIIGYSIKGDPRGVAKEMIDWANEQPIPVLSLDTPSGLDLTTGRLSTPTMVAEGTLTLAMPKQGLFDAFVRKYVGQLFLGDISVPPQLYSEPSLNLEVGNLFRFSDILLID